MSWTMVWSGSNVKEIRARVGYNLYRYRITPNAKEKEVDLMVEGATCAVTA
jgi:hypothetical protein